jgi:ankyrin repeat protein
MKKRRALIMSLLAVFLVVGIPTGIVLSEYRHIQVNRALIAAVKANDTHKALAALNAGAEADYPQNENAPHPIWIQWLNRIAGLKSFPEKVIEPSLLAQAVQHNNTVLVKALLDKGATDVQGFIVSHQYRDSPEKPIPLLAFAAEASNLGICQALVEHGADVNCGGKRTALRMAAAHGRSEVIRFLFQHGATLDTPSDLSIYSLREAVQSGDLESVRLLLAHGADAKYEGRWGSVLGDAVYGGKLAIVKLVVDAGADVNGGFGFTNVLQCAAEAGDVKIVRYLLKKGAKVNAECAWNRTPLMEAVKGNHTAVVKLLLEHGADWRPKEAASGELLQEHGADWRPNDEPGGMGFTQGDTALRLAQRTRNKEIIQMLKNAGAKE